jgi:peptidyl-tRNA hydrolase, PTH1 family
MAASSPLLVVGLGNPGPKYQANRHNIGFMAVDAIARRHGFGPFRSRFQGEIAEGVVDGARVLVLKPMTFMNESGRSVAAAARFFKIPTERIMVLHDELDLAAGKIRVKDGGGHAGHNGLKSLHAHLGAEYRRVRLGIGHPGDKNRVVGYVLEDFAKSDAAWLDPLLDAVADNFSHLAEGDASTFMSKVALALKPPQARPSSTSASEFASKPKSEPASNPKSEPKSAYETSTSARDKPHGLGDKLRGLADKLRGLGNKPRGTNGV